MNRQSVLYAGLCLLLNCGALACPPATAADLVTLTPANWREHVPRGKEVDAILGDFVLRNDQLVMTVAKPIASRNANMTVSKVGGMLIDLTRRDKPSDQLSAYYPAWQSEFSLPGRTRGSGGGETQQGTRLNLSGEEVTLQVVSTRQDGRPVVTLKYSLADGQPFVTVETIYRNPHESEITFDLQDYIRADVSFEFGMDAATNLFWAQDDWFRQAYGVVVKGRTIERTGRRKSQLMLIADGTAKWTLQPGSSFRLVRQIFPGANTFDVRSIAAEIAGTPLRKIDLTVADEQLGVWNAKVTASIDGKVFASGRTVQSGKLSIALPEGASSDVDVTAIGRPPVTQTIKSGAGPQNIRMQQAGRINGKVTDEAGAPIPCKIAFHGKEGTANPNFGPDSATTKIRNLIYTHNGEFRGVIGPGRYDVIISRGPEYDAVFTEIEVQRGPRTRLTATLKRVVDTAGWVSSDFHSHSSPSGDNTGHQFGRVLNLLAEHIEFAPCTEHNRIDSYVPHLRRIKAEHLMATCSGMELTGRPLPINHQNAFPLKRKWRQQDGGGPVTDTDPVAQIQRLAKWDETSEKLVQANHPNLLAMLGDKDSDGEPDGGFEKMFGYMDVIEVHPPVDIFLVPGTAQFEDNNRKPIFHWLQLLNLGYRIPGVVNTDAHYNFHGSGWLRNYIKCSTDDPSQIDTMEMVRQSEAGHLVMSNGPFMTVQASAGAEQAMPGDDLASPQGQAKLQVRVQCPNWLDINRVQVLLNGRASEDHNYTRRTHAEMFGDKVVKFQAEIPLEVTSDTHVIVAAVGEGLMLGRVMGPAAGKRTPCAVSNPIFLDVDGNGFVANGDDLGLKLPVK